MQIHCDCFLSAEINKMSLRSFLLDDPAFQFIMNQNELVSHPFLMFHLGSINFFIIVFFFTITVILRSRRASSPFGRSAV